MKPITPDEAALKKAYFLPESVIRVFNEAIARAWNGTSATIEQDDIVGILMEALDCDRAMIFERGYLDVEPIYETAGWNVVYDRPGFNEGYNATYRFTRK